MDLTFPWPLSLGEWLAWAIAAITLFFGVLLLFAPRISLRLVRLQTVPEHPEALAEVRGTMAGFYLGVGLACILLAQPLLYIALGFSWAFTAFGRLVSILSEGRPTLYNFILFIIEIILAILPLLFAFGFVA